MITRDESFRPGSSFFHRVQEQGFYSLFFLAQAIGGEDLPDDIHIVTLTSGAAQHKNEALPHPEKATIAGPARVIPREFPRLSVSVLDLQLSAPAGRMRRAAEKEEHAALVGHILEDALAQPSASTALLRGGKRFELTYKPAPLTEIEDGLLPVLRDAGTYLITGGFGGIGLTLAEALITRAGAKVALLARSALPEPDRGRAPS